MSKPIVYNYNKAEERIRELQEQNEKLTKEVTNLKIHLRIIYEELKKERGEI